VPRATAEGHVTLGGGDNATARVAVVGEQRVETGDARWTSVAHHVASASQRLTALGTDEVFDVPELTVSLRALVGENYLQQPDDTTLRSNHK